MKLGFTTSDLKGMGYSRLLHFLDANMEMSGTGSDGSHWASQAEIKSILG